MWRFVIYLALLTGSLGTSPSANSLTVGECLLQDGYSHEVLNKPQFTALVGENAWPEPATTALTQGELLSNVYVQTDTGERKIALVLLQGNLFAVILRHPADPAAFEALPDGTTAWHCTCVLRIRFANLEEWW